MTGHKGTLDQNRLQIGSEQNATTFAGKLRKNASKFVEFFYKQHFTSWYNVTLS